MAPENGNYPILFIGGLHRSATTLLGRLLCQHPQICGLEDTGVIEDEGQFLQDVFPEDNVGGGPGRFAFDPNAHLTKDSDLATEGNAEILWRSWSPYWKKSNAKWFTEKTPGNLIHSGFLQALFPMARFLFISRHPIATSLATYKWSGTGIYSLVHHWCHSHELLMSDIGGLQHALHISFESLTGRTRETLALIEEFLRLRPHDYRYHLDERGNQRYFEIWDRVFLSNHDRRKEAPSHNDFQKSEKKGRLDNPKRRLKRYIRVRLFGEERQFSHACFEAQDAVSMFEHRVNTFGYSLLDKQRAPGLPMWLSWSGKRVYESVVSASGGG